MVRETKRVFDIHGFDLRLTIIPNHSHNYAQYAGWANVQAWAFLRKANLSESLLHEHHESVRYMSAPAVVSGALVSREDKAFIVLNEEHHEVR